MCFREEQAVAGVAHTSGVLVALFQRDELFLSATILSSAHVSRKARDGGTPSPARETHALAGQGVALGEIRPPPQSFVTARENHALTGTKCTKRSS
jgi:hypothetical protein